MKLQEIRYRNIGRMGWLLAAILTFGFFACAGQVAESYASHRQSVKVERTLSAEKFEVLNPLGLTKIWTCADGGTAWAWSAPDIPAVSQYHNRLAAVALDVRAGKIAGIEIFIPFTSERSVGSRTDRDSYHPPTG